jgi:hypothetical protein
MNKLGPGGTLRILGTLTSSVIVSKSGTSTSRILIAGGRIAAPHNVEEALLVNGSYVTIANVEVTGGAAFGVRVRSHHVRLVDVSVHDSVWENRIGDACRSDLTGGWGRGLTFAPSSHHVEVSGGSVYNNCGEGVGFTQNQYSYIHDTHVYDNFSRNIYIGNAANVTVENVTSYYSNPNFYRSGKPGRCIGLAIETTNYSTVGNMMRDTVIRGNTLTGCQGINFYAEVSNQYPSNVLVESNTFVRVPSPQVKLPGSNISVRNNTILDSNPDPGGTTQKVYQDRSPAITYSPGWQTVSSSSASGGTYHEVSPNGAFARLAFSGTDFTIVYKGGPSFQRLKVIVDGVKVAVINQNRADSTYNMRWSYPGTLSSGRHVIKLVYLSSKAAGKGSVDAIIVR